MNTLRIGELLVDRGVIDRDQQQRILDEQARSGRPFGVLAEELFDISPRDVEHAWAEQYAAMAPGVDPTQEDVDPQLLDLVSRRQAWQFRVLPLKRSGHELVLCSDLENLPRALRFVGWSIGSACSFVIAERAKLDAALSRHYPLAGMGTTPPPPKATPTPKKKPGLARAR
ncbi:MAG: hypothetical protein SFZ23_02025 [Planctomycetota bacterium]|nr:hypothetical protein [Planctomycetota bacterium]